MFTAPCLPLVCWVFATQESDEHLVIYVVAAFLGMVAIFVLYQKGQSEWTWRELADGFLSILIKALIFGASVASGHPIIPPDDDK